MDNNVRINILDILNKGISDAIDLAVNKYMNEVRSDFISKIDVLEMHYEAVFASYDDKFAKLAAEYEVLHQEYIDIMAGIDRLKERLLPVQESLFDKPQNEDTNKLVREIASIYLTKIYGKDNGAGLIGTHPDKLNSEFYKWCKANNLNIEDGKGQKRVVTNTAKMMFDLKLNETRSAFVRAEVNGESERDAA